MADIELWDGDIADDKDGILPVLKLGRVFSVKRTGKLFRVQERCDRYFDVFLTGEQVRRLGAELISLGSDDEPA